MSWGAKSEGFGYWLGTVSGLVIMAVGIAYAGEFLKQLINGELTKGVWASVKGAATKGWVRVFVASVLAISGVCIILSARRSSLLDEWICYFLGVVLAAGGVTFFWTQSKFHRD
jgi:hypothetical protein